MRLIELEPKFLRIIKFKNDWVLTDDFSKADGIWFYCPKCFPNKKVSNHRIVCWQPHIQQSESLSVGRWYFIGSDYYDLSLIKGSFSIKSGCQAHFYIRNGEIQWAF